MLHTEIYYFNIIFGAKIGARRQIHQFKKP